MPKNIPLKSTRQRQLQLLKDLWSLKKQLFTHLSLFFYYLGHTMFKYCRLSLVCKWFHSLSQPSENANVEPSETNGCQGSCVLLLCCLISITGLLSYFKCTRFISAQCESHCFSCHLYCWQTFCCPLLFHRVHVYPFHRSMQTQQETSD